MKFYRWLLVVAVVSSGLVGCNSDDSQRAEQLQSENAMLRKELEDTKRELEEFKNGPSRLLALAEASVSKADWSNAKTQVAHLLAKHPGTSEVVRAKEINALADAALAKAAKEAQVAEAKRAEEERRKREEEERRLAVALRKMHKKVDSIENIAWYRDQTSPKYSNYNGFFLYIGKQPKSDPWLRLRVQYNADDWLFIQSFLVVADGQRFEYPRASFARDNDSEIWEWYDEPATSRDLEMIKAVINAKNAVIRFTGRQYQRDRTITAAEKAALRNVLDAYKVLGGT